LWHKFVSNDTISEIVNDSESDAYAEDKTTIILQKYHITAEIVNCHSTRTNQKMQRIYKQILNQQITNSEMGRKERIHHIQRPLIRLPELGNNFEIIKR
jgi:hypothetical protein